MRGLLGSCCGGLAVNDRRRLNLSFSMSSPLQREAWALLSAVPLGQRIDTVCYAVCRANERDALLDAVRAAIREGLGSANITTEQHTQPQEAEDVGDDVLGFLFALQQEGDDMN